MKRPLLLSALLLLPLSLLAETVDLGTHGTLSIDVPKGWKLTSEPATDTGVGITLSPPDGVNAQCIVGVAFVPKGATAVKADVDEKVLNQAQPYVAVSVEKKANLRKFALTGDAYGSYCVFTDASLVGKPPEKDNFKVAGLGIVWFNDDVSAVVSLSSDDEKGPDYAAMLAALSSLALTKK
jgi:hypothetical protein